MPFLFENQNSGVRMKTDRATLKTLLGKDIQYQIPLYQRPYVWEEEKQWQPLWEDVCNIADDYIEHLEEDSIKPHFIGAIVLKQIKTKTSELEKRLVIDGQQRIATIQILLKAILDYLSQKDKIEKTVKTSLEKLLQNEDISEEELKEEFSKYKLRPSKRDTEAFLVIMRTRNPKGMKAIIESIGKDKFEKNRIIDAYEFFYEQIEDWLEDAKSDDEFNKKVIAIKNALLKGVELVLIDLDEKDREQIIFETLNARGTPLLKFDLVKNYLYYKAEMNKLNVKDLDSKYWSLFDDDNNVKFWERTVRQGRLHRPASDVFLHHFLTLKKGKEVDSEGLFDEYREIVGKETVNIEEHINELVSYAKIYKKFSECAKDTYEALFFERLKDMDNTTIYPLLLGVFNQFSGADEQIQRDSMLRCLESYIVRRAVCKLTIKNYNNLFIEMHKKLVENSNFSVKSLNRILKEYKAEINRWPNDEEFETAWKTMPLYRILTRSKLRMILKALNNELHDKKSEGSIIEEKDKLTIEHIMPQSWEENWPLVNNPKEDEKYKIAQDLRNNLIHTIGNLTLTNGSLNPALSNAAWKEKKAELQKHSVITMNRLLLEYDDWKEEKINKRAENLFEIALKIWPYDFD